MDSNKLPSGIFNKGYIIKSNSMLKIINRNKLIVASLLSFIFISYACSDTVDVLTFDTPELVIEAERQLLVTVNTSGGQSLTGYDITIEGPTSASESGVGESTYLFTNLSTGDYTITASRDGYVTASVDVEIVLPQNETESYYNEAELFLRERAPFVVANNNEDNVIQTGPSDAEGVEGETVSMSIPAGAFPQDAVDEDGNISISLTRSVPSQVDTEFEGAASDIFDFAPDGLDLNEEIELEIPIAIPAQLVASLGIASGPYNANSGHGISYVLQPGNIPVELVEDNGSNSAISGDSGYSQSIETRVPVRRFRAKVMIKKLQKYKLVSNVRITQHRELSSPRVIARSECAADITGFYDFETGNLSPLLRKFIKVKASRTIARPFSFEGVPGSRLTVRGQHETVRYTARDASGAVIETSTLNKPPITVSVSLGNCHNSGGS